MLLFFVVSHGMKNRVIKFLPTDTHQIRHRITSAINKPRSPIYNVYIEQHEMKTTLNALKYINIKILMPLLDAPVIHCLHVCMCLQTHRPTNENISLIPLNPNLPIKSKQRFFIPFNTNGTLYRAWYT